MFISQYIYSIKIELNMTIYSIWYSIINILCGNFGYNNNYSYNHY